MFINSRPCSFKNTLELYVDGEYIILNDPAILFTEHLDILIRYCEICQQYKSQAKQKCAMQISARRQCEDAFRNFYTINANRFLSDISHPNSLVTDFNLLIVCNRPFELNDGNFGAV